MNETDNPREQRKQDLALGYGAFGAFASETVAVPMQTIWRERPLDGAIIATIESGVSLGENLR